MLLVLFLSFHCIYLFILAVLDLCCRMWVFSSHSEQELFFVVVHGLLNKVASLVAKRKF